MSESQTAQVSMRILRPTALFFAFALGALSLWLIATEMVRPSVRFTTDPQLAMANYGQRDAALAAARLGWVRGDLWAEAAFAYGDVVWNAQDKGLPTTNAVPFQQIQVVVMRALTQAAYDSRLWLLLAGTYFRFDWPDERAIVALKMSYYTGSNTTEVIPKRLFLALQSRALDDDEFQELIRHDIRIALVRKTGLMAALISAYKSAPETGRQFVEKAVSEIEPNALSLIRGSGPPR